MGKRILTKAKVAFNLLAERTCDNCRGCLSRNETNTCDNWEPFIDIRTQIINKLKVVTNNVYNNSISSTKSVNQIQHELKNEISKHIPEVESKVEMSSDSSISVVVKIPRYAEYIQVNLEVKT